MTTEPTTKKTRAADPTATAKRAAAKVRRAVDALNLTLDEALNAGLTIDLGVYALVNDDELSPTPTVTGSVGAVEVASVRGQVTL